MQLIITGVGVSGYLAVVNAVRPNNIAIGIWNLQRTTTINSFKVDVKSLEKASNILVAITLAIQVGEGIYNDINRGY